jgi:hypothetical protein
MTAILIETTECWRTHHHHGHVHGDSGDLEVWIPKRMAGQILPMRWLPYWHTFGPAGEVAGVEEGEEEEAAPSAGRRC